MDWPRAKTLIILALVLLNGFLAYHLYLRPVIPPPQPVYLTAATEEQVLRALAEFAVEARLPDSWPTRLPLLALEPRPPAFDPAVLLGDEEVTVSSGSYGPCAGRVYTGASRVLCVGDDGYVIYAGLRRRPDRPARPTDLAEAHRRVTAFLERIGGVPDDMEGPEITYDTVSGLLVFRYTQVITETSTGALRVFPGFIELRVDATQVVSYEQRLWNLRGDASDPEPVMPVTTVLLRQLEPGGRLHELLAGSGRTASNDGQRGLTVRLGYALGERRPDEGRDAAGPAFDGRPAWQVTIEGAGSLLFDARSGEPLEPTGP